MGLYRGFNFYILPGVWEGARKCSDGRLEAQAGAHDLRV